MSEVAGDNTCLAAVVRFVRAVCVACVVGVWALSSPAHAQTSASALPDTSHLMSPSPEGAKVYIISPRDGEVVSETFQVLFGLEGMGVAPAGVPFNNTGHHHLLMNVDTLPNLTLPIPADEQHLHFGLGQTQAEVTLPPGEHRLQLLLGNHLHIPHDPPVMSNVITINVK